MRIAILTIEDGLWTRKPRRPSFMARAKSLFLPMSAILTGFVLGLSPLFIHTGDNGESENLDNEERFIESEDGTVVKKSASSDPFIVYTVISKKGNIITMAKVNEKYCRPSEDGKNIVYAPVAFPPKLGAPTEYDYNSHGWYRKNIQPPETPEGKVLSEVRYVVEDNSVVAKYEYVDRTYTIDDYDMAMEDHLRQEREERGYTTREPDSYLTSTNPRWKADAEDWVAHRDAVMEYALQIINAVESGEREPPTLDEFVAGLPNIIWRYE